MLECRSGTDVAHAGAPNVARTGCAGRYGIWIRSRHHARKTKQLKNHHPSGSDRGEEAATEGRESPGKGGPTCANARGRDGGIRKHRGRPPATSDAGRPGPAGRDALLVRATAPMTPAGRAHE